MRYPLISIIVPVYNVEQYLSCCIESILAQTFTNFELLLIDDGSKDRSRDICEKYASKNNHIKVFHKKNGGVSSARNMGLDNARGEWIAFVDSDDIVSNLYLQNMASAIMDEDMMVLSNYHKNTKTYKTIKLDNVTLHNEEIVRYFIDNNILALSAPYSKLYKRSVIKNNSIRFPEGIQMGEDAIFIMQYLNHVTSVAVIDVCDYTVRNTENSLSSKYYPFEKEWECYEVWKKEMLFFLTRFGNIYENPIKIAWENRIGDAFNRCLLCLFRQKATLTFKQQIKSLYSIPISDIKEFYKYYKVNNLRRKILKLLIVKRLFRLYILCSKFDHYRNS